MTVRTTRLLVALLAAATVSACQDGGTAAAPSRTATPAATPSQAVVPGVVGKRLTDAEAALSAAGFGTVKPVDSTDQHRAVLNAENWVVESQSPAANTRADPGTTVTLSVRKPSDGAGGGAMDGVVPNVVCKDLQTAQDTLQAAGFHLLGSADGTGQGRVQVIDRNWVVIRQSAAAGSRPGASTRIVLTAVKFGEPTGDSGCKS
jgi:hypothetical protein